MIFWLGILVAVTFAYYAVKTGFYETCATFFNLVISIYLAIFLGPVVAGFVTSQNTLCSVLLPVLATAVGAFFVLHGITYVFFTGQAAVPFHKAVDVLGSSLLGFLAGWLVWSFIVLLLVISPLAKQSFVQDMNLTEHFQKSDAPYIAWWCDRINWLISPKDARVPASAVLADLLDKNHPAPSRPPVAAPASADQKNESDANQPEPPPQTPDIQQPNSPPPQNETEDT